MRKRSNAGTMHSTTEHKANNILTNVRILQDCIKRGDSVPRQLPRNESVRITDLTDEPPTSNNTLPIIDMIHLGPLIDMVNKHLGKCSL